MSAVPDTSAPTPIFRFSTTAFAKSERLAALREIFGRTVCHLDIDPRQSETFSFDATACGLPGLGVLFAESGAMDLAHTRELIVDDDLSFMAAPTCRFVASQLGRTVELEPGAGVLMTNAEVGTMKLAAAARFVTFRVPRAPIAPLVPDLEAAVARRIPANHTAFKLLVGYLENAYTTQALTTPELQNVAVTHICDLLALTLGATRDAGHIAYTRGMRAARLRAAKAFVARNVARHDLTVAHVAAYLEVTPRYIHMLFDTEGFSFMTFLVQQRLALAHRMLSNRRMTEWTISAIAFAAGFNDLSHFNRTFRQRFGMTPSDLRRSLYSAP